MVVVVQYVVDLVLVVQVLVDGEGDVLFECVGWFLVQIVFQFGCIDCIVVVMVGVVSDIGDLVFVWLVVFVWMVLVQ